MSYFKGVSAPKTENIFRWPFYRRIAASSHQWSLDRPFIEVLSPLSPSLLENLGSSPTNLHLPVFGHLKLLVFKELVSHCQKQLLTEKGTSGNFSNQEDTAGFTSWATQMTDLRCFLSTEKRIRWESGRVNPLTRSSTGFKPHALLQIQGGGI